MHHIGIDLAWGDRRPTGLAVVDEECRLVHVSTVITDDEIAAALAPYVDGDCLVAIDAPLVVTNPTGNRACEKELNRDFARFDAGAHPANTGKPEFQDQPRGARIAARLKLDLNPRSGRGRRAIEVYPHPATVALFRLGRTLKYKNRTGRKVEQLQAELTVLMGLIEGLAHAYPPLIVAGERWGELTSAVHTARRKSELRVVEDQVDAVLCAYIGLFADRRPASTTTYGDVETGYIVTPTLPEDLEPTPRARRAAAASAKDAGAAVRAYAERFPEVQRGTELYVQLVTSILDDAGINYLTVTGRAKAVTSFAGKAVRTAHGLPLYTDPLREITDQIGTRVITYVHSDVQAVADLLGESFVVLDDRDMGQETASEGRFGYASRHLLIGVDPESGLPGYEGLQGLHAQVQIRTVLQHAWAEFEHDIRYKGTIPDAHVPDFDRRFTLAAGLLELADREFSTIRDRLREPLAAEESAADDDDPRLSPRELAAFLAGQYADAGWSRTDHYAWMAGLVLELGITSLAELGETLRSVDGATLAERMDYRYPPGAVRRLDDALLWTYGEDYVRLSGNAHRVPSLRARLVKMRPDPV
ncbi:bifunctional ribonuclease/(p)ppGpp synthase [Nocardioides maradonensis]